MTFTYSNPEASDRDAVRFLVGDTVEAEHFLENEEITWLIKSWSWKGSLYYVAAVAADSIAAKLAREISVSSEGQSLDLSQLMTKYQTLAASLRDQHKDLLVGGTIIYMGGVDAREEPDPNIKPLAFGTGMHDIREAGRQDYGEVGDVPEYGWEIAP